LSIYKSFAAFLRIFFQAIKLQQQRLNDMKKMLQKELKTTPSDLTMANGGDYGTSSLAFWLGIHRRRRFISEYAERAFFSFAPKQVLMFPVIYVFLIFHASANISRNLIVSRLSGKTFGEGDSDALKVYVGRGTIASFQWKTSWFGSKPMLRTGIFSANH